MERNFQVLSRRKKKERMGWWKKNNFIIKTLLIVSLAGACVVSGYWITTLSNKATPQNLIIHNPKSTPEEIKEAKDQRFKMWIGNFLSALGTLFIGAATLYVILREDKKMIDLLGVIANNTSSYAQ
jgi:hypothetical protein